MELSTPALLFPAVSLLFLSYSNRFLAIASLIRNLHSEYKNTENIEVLLQLTNLKYRLKLIKWMEFFGVLSFVSAAFTMFCSFAKWDLGSYLMLAFAIVALIISLILALLEISSSIGALSVLLGEVRAKICDCAQVTESVS